ncbi:MULTISPECIES: hypothetical protein [unclassified Thioalkalivibrio]|uniref:hypothetical protein n=1 Tax=unclassified Thioalkalivibrio TaxID=2621013 RepID=UPI000374E9C3|nr:MULTISPECIES: hypothetical protein [unclassified Thioalkalivibrio]
MPERTPNTIRPEDFPELRLICWHRDPKRPLSESEAFGLYEANWRYIDVGRLTQEEADLIDRLKRDYGKGVING